MTLILALKFLLILALAGVLGSLVIGVGNLIKNSEKANIKSNKMMQYRIIFHVIALLIFSLLLWLKVK